MYLIVNNYAKLIEILITLHPMFTNHNITFLLNNLYTNLFAA